MRLASQAAAQIRGEAQLISPFGSWAAVSLDATVLPSPLENMITLRYHVGVPITTRRGTQWWTMVKLMYFGRLHYTCSIPVIICD